MPFLPNPQTAFVAILRTGCLMHFDWACSALDEAGVPYQCGEETSGGLRVALPAMPTPGPGTWWSVRVPTPFAEQAEELIESLPFERTLAPDVWDFRPKPLGRLAWQVFIWSTLGLVTISYLTDFLGLFR
ncbi:MAG: hypothetical protein RIS76_1876 [Verrucomicrobiota bacterium]|jgi:hypothetical protein